MDADLQAALDARNKRKQNKTKDKGLFELSSDLIAAGGDESVSVCVRVRPFNRREIEIQQSSNEIIRSVVEMPDGVSGKLRLLHRDETSKEYHEVEVFNFSRTFWSIPEEQQHFKYLPISQEDMFEAVGRSVVANAIGGFNVCVFAYGQTGSGKTHTMMGDVTIGKDGNFQGDPGLIPRLCRELFAAAQKRCSDVESSDEGENTRLSIDIKLSAIEIYNEQVRDLFWRESSFSGRSKNTVLKIRKHPTEGHFVDELTVMNPKSWPECVQRIAAGLSERTVAATLMNDESSRSHSVFQILVQQTETVAPPPDQPYEKPVITTRVSRINLVDLAGSERLKKSGAQGQQQKEAAGINLSLSTLKKVIDALVTNSTEKNPKKLVLIPYRESALTQLLSHSLGGNSKTTMIACVSPHYDNQEETLLTLRYANRAKGIVNHVKSNENNAAKQEKLLKDQLASLQARLNEGPQCLNETQIADLRDQLQIGHKTLEEMQNLQSAQEKETARLAELLRSQKDQRYASSYFSSFKRVLLERVRDRSQGKLTSLEAQLNRVTAEKDNIAQVVGMKERSLRESEYNISDLRRKEELYQLRSARNEALARQLARDIAKTKKKADENLMTRFGLIMVRDRNIKTIRASLVKEKETARKDHDQYLQSIVREAKKQFEYLCAAYADKEASQQERLSAVERSRELAIQQLEKSQHLLFSLQSSYERATAEHQRREKERQTSWAKRFDDMKTLYEEKLAQLQERRDQGESQWRKRVEAASLEAEEVHKSRVENLMSQLDCVAREGNRRCADIESEMTTQMNLLIDRTNIDAARAAADIRTQFEDDERKLMEVIDHSSASLKQKRTKLEELHRFAITIDSTAAHAKEALEAFQGRSTDMPLDAVLLLKNASSFLNKYNSIEGQIDVHNNAAMLLRKSLKYC